MAMSGKAPSDAETNVVSTREGDGRTPRVAPEPAKGRVSGGGGGNGGKDGSCETVGEGNRGIKRVSSASSSPEADASSRDALRKAGTAGRDGALVAAKDKGNKNNNEDENNKNESEEGDEEGDEEGEEEGEGEGSDDWYTAGSQYLRKRVGRIVNEERGTRSFAAGTVVGWLPIEVADFVSEYTNEAAALWHIKFDREEVRGESRPAV